MKQPKNTKPNTTNPPVINDAKKPKAEKPESTTHQPPRITRIHKVLKAGAVSPLCATVFWAGAYVSQGFSNNNWNPWGNNVVTVAMWAAVASIVTFTICQCNALTIANRIYEALSAVAAGHKQNATILSRQVTDLQATNAQQAERINALELLQAHPQDDNELAEMLKLLKDMSKDWPELMQASKDATTDTAAVLEQLKAIQAKLSSSTTITVSQD